MEDEKPAGVIYWALAVMFIAVGYVGWKVFNLLVGP